jgi:3-hydroxyisobutyrate dehydrogenase-like beta-hydroxyacid dehydrogenase
VLDGLVSKALETGIPLDDKIWIDTSTVHPDTCARSSERLGQKGAIFVASPVFGASPIAAAGKLIFSMAGPATTIDRIGPFILAAMGKSIINMGEDVRKASLLKISGYVFSPAPSHRMLVRPLA